MYVSCQLNLEIASCLREEALHKSLNLNNQKKNFDVITPPYPSFIASFIENIKGYQVTVF